MTKNTKHYEAPQVFAIEGLTERPLCDSGSIYDLNFGDLGQPGGSYDFDDINDGGTF